MTVLLFAGEAYYAKGGMNDFQGSYSSVESAMNSVELFQYGIFNQLYDWYQIIDQETLEVLARSENQAHGVGYNDYVPDED
jgi:hypothetical protein